MANGVFDPKFHENRARRSLEAMLREWYHDQALAASEITAHGKSIQSIGTLADALLKKKVTPEVRASLQLHDAWSEIIGSPLDRYTQFYRLIGACAEITVSHPAFLKELMRQDLQTRLIDRINARLGAPLVEQLRVLPAGQQYDE